MMMQKTAMAERFAQAQQAAAQGRWQEAEAGYTDCLRRDARFGAAHLALGQLYAALGRVGDAHALLSRALHLSQGDPAALRLAAPALAAILALFMPDVADAALERDLLACFAVDTVDAQALARVTADVLLLKGLPAPVERLATDPLWLAFLTRCLNNHPALETALATMRRRLLLDHVGRASLPRGVVRTAAAIALQCFANEYVWPVSAAEAAALAAESDGVLAAMYRPLIDLGIGPAVRRLKKDRLSGLLVRRTYDDLATERALAPAMPSLGAAPTNPVSIAVRAQYEDHPYPRWQTPPAPRPADLRDVVERFPSVDRAALPHRLEHILIAGCGTGHETVGVARNFPGTAITAVDLSRASLAYAKRMAQDLDIAGVDFRHGDILDLPSSGLQVDIAYSAGVLHHMDDPAAGLTSICRVLRPGGVIRLALYSERGRTPIRAARALIAERGWTPDATGIRAFRSDVLARAASDPLASLHDADDFYSQSGCRDLVFHVQEHYFTLPGVAMLLQSCGLRLIAFDAAPAILGAFHDAFGPAADTLDLGLWDRLEAHQPTLFAGMYQFWCQRAP